MKKNLGDILLGRKELTEQQNWVIVNDNKIISSYTSFKDAVKDKRGHLMTLTFYKTNYTNPMGY